MSSGNETDDADREVCELLDPNRKIEVDSSRNPEIELGHGRRPERKRNIVRRQISFNRKEVYMYAPLGCQDTNFEASIVSAATNQVLFEVPTCVKFELAIRRLFSMTSNRLSCHFGSVVANFLQTWKNICDLEPSIDETKRAFEKFSPKNSIETSQSSSSVSSNASSSVSSKVSSTVSSKVSSNDLENPLPDENVQNQDLNEILPDVPLEEDDDEEKYYLSLILEQTLSFDKVKNLLELPRRKLIDYSSEMEYLISEESFSQLLSCNCEEGLTAASESSASPDVEIQNLAIAEVEAPARSQNQQEGLTAANESSASPDVEIQNLALAEVEAPGRSLIQQEETLISSPFGRILSEALARMDPNPSRSEPFYENIIDNVCFLPFPGDDASPIQAFEYNLAHRFLHFRTYVPILHRNLTSQLNRIECYIRRLPVDTRTQTLKQYLGYLLDVESKITKFNPLCTKTKYKIESDRLRRLAGSSSIENDNSNYFFSWYKKYYISVKYIYALEELRDLSEKFYSYIVKQPNHSFIV